MALYDGNDGLLDPMGVRSIPGLAFVDARGVVIAAATGNRDRDFILRHARSLAR